MLTNAHVITTAPDQPVERATRLFVEFSNGDRVAAGSSATTCSRTSALLKVDPGSHTLTRLPLGDSAHVIVGEPVAAIGSPFGNENSLSVGVVSATRRSIRS